MISAFQRQIEHLTDSVARNFGDVVRVETTDGRVATVRAVYLPSTLTAPVTDSGAEVHDPAARLDFRLADLLAAGLADPRNDLYDAVVILRGERYRLDNVIDDRIAMVRTSLISAAD